VDGLHYYRGIVAQAFRHLLPGGALIMEIGSAMAQAVEELLRRAANYTAPLVHQDYGCRDRVIVAHAASPKFA
jgi:methylase of polypeptide subunit release factors